MLDPFAGIGSTGYESIKHGRKFIGVELKPSYFAAAKKNLARIMKEKTQATLYDGLFEETSENATLPEESHEDSTVLPPLNGSREFHLLKQ